MDPREIIIRLELLRNCWMWKPSTSDPARLG